MNINFPHFLFSVSSSTSFLQPSFSVLFIQATRLNMASSFSPSFPKVSFLHTPSPSSSSSSSSSPKFSITKSRGKFIDNAISIVLGCQTGNWVPWRRGYFFPLRTDILSQFIVTHITSASPSYPWMQLSCSEVFTASAASGCINDDDGCSVAVNNNHVIGINQIDYLLKSLHQFAKKISINIQSHELLGGGPELSKAWIGVDVRACSKHIAYKAVVYVLLQTMKDMGIAINDEYGNYSHLFIKIVSPMMRIILEDFESHLNMKNSKLLEWFQMEQLPVFSVHFATLLGSWSSVYPTSGIAVIVLAISCAIAVQKLGTERISCPLFTSSLPDMIEELMELLFRLSSLDKLQKFAAKAGFELEFLTHFGSNLLYHNTSFEMVLWVSLVRRKLIVSFQRECVVTDLQRFHDRKILEENLATLGLFAFLGKKTRLFLSCMAVKDLDEPLKNFLRYLECGSLFIYPELTLSEYELFMEVVTEEIGWLDFYAAIAGNCHAEKRRSNQAKKEIILSTVFNVCSYVFSSFAHFRKSTQLSLDANLNDLLIRSQTLLNICLEDYCAAYDKLCELPKSTEVRLPEPKSLLENCDIVNMFMLLEDVHHKPGDLVTNEHMKFFPQSIPRMSKSTGSDKIDSVLQEKVPYEVKMKPTLQSLLRTFSSKLISSTSDLWMGTQLLFADISAALGILKKRLCGHPLTQRERKKLSQTLTDVTFVFPIAILMVIPVSAVGHAAILAVIKRYIPFLIPSPRSAERLDVIKLLKRIKKVDIQSCSNLRVPLSI